MSAPRRLLVTGADGFVGRTLVRTLAAHPAFATAAITLNDRAFAGPVPDARFRQVPGDFGEEPVRAALVEDRPDILFHIGGILGGAAEADYALARRVNIDATLSLIEAVRRDDAPPRVVFTSSIAVFGPPLPATIDDATEPHPLMNYGAHKRMLEIAIEHFSARGWIDGLALRLPGIIARPHADARLKSAFLNRMFEAARDGETAVLPVSPGGTTWLLSAQACAEALVHAALLPTGRIGPRRAFTLPAQRVSFAELVEAIDGHCPGSSARMRFEPDPVLDAQFGSQPPLETPYADALGFRHDGDLGHLVAHAFKGLSQ